MIVRLKSIHNKYACTVRPLFRVLIRLPVHADMWITDQMFLLSRNNPALGRPSVLGMLFGFLAYLWRAIKIMWAEAWSDYVLHVYHRRNPAHYAKGGRAYADLLSAEECVGQFAGLTSRLQMFVDSYSMMVGYQDGESFLDAGCGKGQNLKFILDRFPHSPYAGFDIDERCLQVAKVGAEGGVNRSLRRGSILDFDFLRSFEDKSVDHICVCHVFSTLLSPTIYETKLNHQRIIDEFVRMSRKSIMIIDGMSLGRSFDVEVEHLTRAVVCENISSYFERHQSLGEACVLSCQDLRAVLFKSRRA